MAVFRVEHRNNYTVLANHHFRDENLSLKAKGILSLMLSLPEEWDYSLAGLVSLSKDGTDATKAALKELEENGYLSRKAIRENGKIVDWDYSIYETPVVGFPLVEKPLVEKPLVEKPLVEKPLVEKPLVEKQPLLNTKESSTEESSTEKSNTKQSSQSSKDAAEAEKLIASFSDDPETLELLRDWLEVRKKKRAPFTERAIRENLAKLPKYAEDSNLSINDYLKEVICRGWQAFFEIPDYSSKKSKRQTENDRSKISQTYTGFTVDELLGG